MRQIIIGLCEEHGKNKGELKRNWCQFLYDRASPEQRLEVFQETIKDLNYEFDTQIGKFCPEQQVAKSDPKD